jgi:hypothetical protein
VFALLIGAVRTRIAQAVTVLVLTALSRRLVGSSTSSRPGPAAMRHATIRPFITSR